MTPPGEPPTRPNGGDWTDRVAALLAAGRTTEAEHEANQVLARDPANVLAHYWTGQCQLRRGDPQGAEGHWRRASALAPDDPAIGILGVRCALAADRREDALARAARVVQISAPTAETSYWMAVTAAWAGETRTATEWIDRATTLDPGGALHLYAQAEVGLALSGRRDAGEAVAKAKAAVASLLARDPLDQRAHRLKVRLTRLGHGDGKGPEAELAALADAARAGVVETHGGVRDASLRALARPMLGLAWMLLGISGFALSGAHDMWLLPAAGALLIWLALFSLLSRRTRRVVRLIPAAGRARIVRTATAGTLVLGPSLVAGALLAIVVLLPVDAARAEELGLGVQTKTITLDTSTSQVIPGPAGPLIPVPGSPGGSSGGPAFSQPASPSIVIRNPSFRTAEVERFDEAAGLAMIRYLVALAAATIVVGVALTLDALLLRRSAARPLR